MASRLIEPGETEKSGKAPLRGTLSQSAWRTEPMSVVSTPFSITGVRSSGKPSVSKAVDEGSPGMTGSANTSRGSTGASPLSDSWTLLPASNAEALE
jgi:hypothetical protein